MAEALRAVLNQRARAAGHLPFIMCPFRQGVVVIQGVRGAPDIGPPDSKRLWQRLEGAARGLLERYDYAEIRTPVFERTELFVRGIGEGTDIVEKEMYTFQDKGGESLTLRPEGTAPAVRWYLEQGRSERGSLVKVYYIGPMFRHERPQAGRFRQFHQIGAEAIGVGAPEVDAEVLEMLASLFASLGLRDVTLDLNTIGDAACRPVFRERFAAYMRDRKDQLCADCLVRLEKNPLRIMDCKNPQCQAAVAGAPKAAESLCDACRAHFARVRGLLDAMAIPYVLNERLVRGLDYYTRTTFEFTASGLGAQNAIAGGGRYDGLIETIGGPPTPAIGFALGMERVILCLKALEGPGTGARVGVYVAHADGAGAARAPLLGREMRQAGLRVATNLEGRSLKGQMRQADQGLFRYCVIIGEEELRGEHATVRDLETKEQVSVPFAQLCAWLATRAGGTAAP
jgi:histidyl-tRNA synthetase